MSDSAYRNYAVLNDKLNLQVKSFSIVQMVQAPFAYENNPSSWTKQMRKIEAILPGFD